MVIRASLIPVVRNKSPGSGGASPGPSGATAAASAQAGPRTPGPIPPRHTPWPQPAHTACWSPAPVLRWHRRSPRRLSHPSELWLVRRNQITQSADIYWHGFHLPHFEVGTTVLPSYIYTVKNKKGATPTWGSSRRRNLQPTVGRSEAGMSGHLGG